ncbi:MAG: UTP--glucose-1-phosphate uridylyltransferase, partial [uncultured Acetobacteraceae bacterium]
VSPQAAQEGRPARRRPRHPLPPRHQGAGEGDAAGGGQAADPVRDRGGARRRHRAVLPHHRPRQDLHRRALRPRLRAGAHARRARQEGRTGGASRHGDGARVAGHGAPAGADGPRPRHLVRPLLRRRRPLRHPAARRPDALRHAGHEAARGRVPRDRRQRGRHRGGAARQGQSLRRAGRGGGQRPPRFREGPGREAAGREGAVQPDHHRPLRADAGGDKPPRPHGAGRRRRGAAHGRHGEPDRHPTLPWAPLRRPPLRLRGQGGVPGSADRFRHDAARHGAGRARIPPALPL